jgi:hypothetical protein
MVADRTLHAQLNSRPEASPPPYRRKSGCVQLPPPPSLVTRHFSDRTTGQGRASHIPEGRKARSNRTGDRGGFAIRCPGGFRRMRRGTRGVDTLRNHPKRPVAGNRRRPVLRVRRQPPRPRGRELRALRTTRGQLVPTWTSSPASRTSPFGVAVDVHKDSPWIEGVGCRRVD